MIKPSPLCWCSPTSPETAAARSPSLPLSLLLMFFPLDLTRPSPPSSVDPAFSETVVSAALIHPLALALVLLLVCSSARGHQSCCEDNSRLLLRDVAIPFPIPSLALLALCSGERAWFTSHPPEPLHTARRSSSLQPSPRVADRGVAL
jgi:hypothetical protein